MQIYSQTRTEIELSSLIYFPNVDKQDDISELNLSAVVYAFDLMVV